MAIMNTPRLTRGDVDRMNSGIRSYGAANITAADINGTVPQRPDMPGLAEYFGVTPRTVYRWFAPEGSQYRRCLRLLDGTIENTTQPGAVGKRIYCMNEDYAGYNGGILALRRRIFLCAVCALSQEGGLQREPLFTGDPLEDRRAFYTLPEALKFIQDIWSGGQTDWIQRAWIELNIFLEVSQTDNARRWVALVTYNAMTGADYDSEAGEYLNEETLPDEDDGTEGICP